jgi:hypothetical protein
MRNVIVGLIAVTAAGAATLVASGPAAARDYPYCLRGGGYGYPGECSYTSYAQCQASASGRLAFCDVNPRFAFAQQRRGRPYRNY